MILLAGREIPKERAGKLSGRLARLMCGGKKTAMSWSWDLPADVTFGPVDRS